MGFLLLASPTQLGVLAWHALWLLDALLGVSLCHLQTWPSVDKLLLNCPSVCLPSLFSQGPHMSTSRGDGGGGWRRHTLLDQQYSGCLDYEVLKSTEMKYDP